MKNGKALKCFSTALMALSLVLNISGGAFAAASASSFFGSIVVQAQNPYAQAYDHLRRLS